MRSTERARRGRSWSIIPPCSAESCAPPSELGGGVPGALSPLVVQNHPLHRASSAGAFLEHYPPCSAESCAPPSELGGGVPGALSPLVVQNHALHRASSAGALH